MKNNMFNIVPNKALTLQSIPLPESSWYELSEFALTFRGYDLPNCAELSNSHIAKTLTELRASLFFEQRRYHHFGYDPLDEELEYIRNSDKLLHYSLSALLGAGSLGVDEHQNNDDSYNEHDHHSDTVFVFEPSMNGIVNINPWFRLGAGISYRFVNGANIIDVDSNDVGGPAATLIFKFGKF